MQRKGIIQSDIFQIYDENVEHEERDKFKVNFVSIENSVDSQVSWRKNPENGIIGLGPDPSMNVFYKWFNRAYIKIPKAITLCMADNGGYLELGRPLEDPKFDT